MKTADTIVNKQHFMVADYNAIPASYLSKGFQIHTKLLNYVHVPDLRLGCLWLEVIYFSSFVYLL